MSITLFIVLLTIFSVVTGFCTEGCKKMLDELKVSYASNVLAFIVACVVGMLGTIFYYIVASVEFSAANIACIILMGIATAVGAMVGYDKVVQTIEQLKNKF